MKFKFSARHGDFQADVSFNESDPFEIIDQLYNFLHSCGYMRSTLESAMVDYLNGKEHNFISEPAPVYQLSKYRKPKDDSDDPA